MKLYLDRSETAVGDVEQKAVFLGELNEGVGVVSCPRQGNKFFPLFDDDLDGLRESFKRQGIEPGEISDIEAAEVVQEILLLEAIRTEEAVELSSESQEILNNLF